MWFSLQWTRATRACVLFERLWGALWSAHKSSEKIHLAVELKDHAHWKKKKKKDNLVRILRDLIFLLLTSVGFAQWFWAKAIAWCLKETLGLAQALKILQKGSRVLKPFGIRVLLETVLQLKIISGILQVSSAYLFPKSCGELQRWQPFKQSLTIRLYAF